MQEMEHQFLKSLELSEKKSKLSQTINRLTAKKGGKYVMLQDLQSELDTDDKDFEEIMSSARKANRHSNKYIFTDIDGKQAIGISAAKRAKREADSSEVSVSQQTEPKVGASSQTGAIETDGSDSDSQAITAKKDSVKESILWKAYKANGWKGLQKVEPNINTSLSVSEAINEMVVPRFIDLVRNEVLDSKTDLVWQKEVPRKSMTWAEANKYVKQVPGWRLPTIKELESLADKTNSRGLNQIFWDYTNKTSALFKFYWSSTPHVAYDADGEKISMHWTYDFRTSKKGPADDENVDCFVRFVKK